MAKEKKTDNDHTKHTHKATNWLTRTPLKVGGELRCSGRMSSSCCTSDTRHVNLVTNPVISHEWGKDRKVFSFELKCNYQHHRNLYPIDRMILFNKVFIEKEFGKTCWYFNNFSHSHRILQYTLVTTDIGLAILNIRTYILQ